MSVSVKDLVAKIEAQQLRKNIPHFRVGDTVRVHARIVEGNKERIQIFEGLIIKRHRGNQLKASFTVRKVSYNVGVERTFLLHSPRIEKIEVVGRGKVRRSRLFYLRPLRGKASRIKSQLINADSEINLVSVKEEPVAQNGNTNGGSSSADDTSAQEASA